MNAVKLNDRARNVLKSSLQPGETISATIPVNNRVGAARHNGQAASALGLPYATARGLDMANRTFRSDLMGGWITITDHRLLFHQPNHWSIRPKPGKLIDAVPRAGTTVTWFDLAGITVNDRVLHLQFPDGRQVLTVTLIGTRLKKSLNSEPDLFIAAFGDAATEYAAASSGSP